MAYPGIARSGREQDGDRTGTGRGQDFGLIFIAKKMRDVRLWDALTFIGHHTAMKVSVPGLEPYAL